ncbi:hydroxymethylbilane synthase [Acidicapsa ligni]|uniref:hydroxymethylbilane synthase n=1 Tax=Acidicapsa ligni TaxID=542300 RepID=UPI0021E0CAA4|nr:hydroxymethylbilane synthase [Acidicapsa ligni]
MIRIGSRGSQLALWQANHIADLLRQQGHVVGIEVIKTTGDRMQEVTFAQVGSKGMFTLEIEEALAEGRVDLAVHSLKDLPTELPAQFTLAATPPRVDPRDVLVSKDFATFADLPAGSKVGTSSLRRRSQLRHLRPDLEFIEFRGNVDTRLRKLGEGQAAAIILAAAGLDRLEKTEWIRERLEPEVVCPAAGQGALGIETRKDDAVTMQAIAFLDDSATRFAVTAERTALAALGGGCQVPIGVHCRRISGELAENRPGFFEILGLVSDPEGNRILRGYATGDSAEELGHEVAGVLLNQGASQLFQGIGIH